MPDAKVWSRERARRFLRMPDYPEVMRATIREMGRQVGKLALNHDGLAFRGLLVRHLVMSGMFDETAEILRWIAGMLGPDRYVDLMAQYYPAGLVGRTDVRDPHPEINRHLHRDEYVRAVELADELGLRRLDRAQRGIRLPTDVSDPADREAPLSMDAHQGGDLDDRLGTAASAARTVVSRDRSDPRRRNWFGVA
jgi:putative pyruvate formate lyase activating enzyme